MIAEIPVVSVNDTLMHLIPYNYYGQIQCSVEGEISTPRQTGDTSFSPVPYFVQYLYKWCPPKLDSYHINSILIWKHHQSLAKLAEYKRVKLSKTGRREYKKVLEKLTTHLLFTEYTISSKTRIAYKARHPKIFFCWVCIRGRGNMVTKPLP